ncbi:DEAD/DEAH box helicase, partial [Crossiella equi]
MLVQATYDMAGRRMAFWAEGDSGLVADLHALGLPPGEPGTLAVALPVDGRQVVASSVPARFVEVRAVIPALAAVPDGASLSASVRTWRAAATLVREQAEDGFRELAASMPVSAHAALRGDGLAIPAPGAVLRAFRTAAAPEVAPEVRARLRDYQRRGVTWLAELPARGGGGILADEMGLGKTLQAICLFTLRGNGKPHLVVCPTSLLGTWERELARFAPQLAVLGFHGTRRDLRLSGAPVVVTSYAVLRRDAERLAAVDWDVLVLDEAQQVKNPTAQAAKAARALTAELRVAMTGTPVENRLDELWAILSLTNPGLLGTRSRFRTRFAVPIEARRSVRVAERLSGLVAPYLLRRTKSEVAPELPPKLEVLVTCTLTREQADLYRRHVAEAFDAGLGSGVTRRGRVLALLTKLKQVCNHPAQALGEEDGPLAGRSGKLDRVTEMLAEIADSGAHALVFTQYRAMGELLVRHLTEELGTPVPFLHGGLGAQRRDRMVQDFQGGASPALVLSLRAAGYGLTLTRASHVLHYDRWWNPAVE